MSRIVKRLIVGLIVVVVLAVTAWAIYHIYTPASQQTATPASSATLVPTVAATPTETAGVPTTPGTSPTEATSSQSAPADTPTTGPQSDTPITRVCVGVPVNLHYLGQCKVSDQPTLTGRQAFEACIRAAQHIMARVSDNKYGQLHNETITQDNAVCTASIGMSGSYGEVLGYPSGQTGVRFLVLQDTQHQITRAFDGSTGLLLRVDADSYLDKILKWEGQFNTSGE